MSFQTFNLLILSSFFTPPNIDRRTFLTGSFYSERIHKFSSETVPKPIIDQNDQYAHWSLFGVTPPPIEKKITYDELLREINGKNILTLQIATQHDTVVATTVRGHRLAVPLKDEDFSALVLSSMDENGNLPFIVLPYDQVRGAIRNIAQYCAILFTSFVGLDQLNLFPWQISSFSSIKERNEFIENGKRPKKLVDYIRTIVDGIKNTTTL